jgi:hypothetical protein
MQSNIQSHTPPTPVLIKDLGMKFPTETSSYKKRFGLYKCHCGAEFETHTASVKNGDCKSCGCHRVLSTKERETKHGMSKHPLYNTWKEMIKRTTNPKIKDFANYVGRGIKVSDRWQNVENFISDMYPSYQINLTLDRRDNDKGYSIENCRWATKSVQARNTRKIISTNTSGYRGVSWDKTKNKWIAQISVNYKNIRLGRYTTALEAAKAYDNYVISHNLEHTINGVL